MARPTRPAAPSSLAPAGPIVDPRYHAVEIVCGRHACPAALELKSKRFLSRQSPPILPLKACDQPGACTCKYAHHDDRREGRRREADTGIWDAKQLEMESNRRLGLGRRKQD